MVLDFLLWKHCHHQKNSCRSWICPAWPPKQPFFFSTRKNGYSQSPTTLDPVGNENEILFWKISTNVKFKLLLSQAQYNRQVNTKKNDKSNPIKPALKSLWGTLHLVNQHKLDPFSTTVALPLFYAILFCWFNHWTRWKEFLSKLYSLVTIGRIPILK